MESVAEIVKLLPDVNRHEHKFGVVLIAAGIKYRLSTNVIAAMYKPMPNSSTIFDNIKTLIFAYIIETSADK